MLHRVYSRSIRAMDEDSLHACNWNYGEKILRWARDRYGWAFTSALACTCFSQSESSFATVSRSVTAFDFR